MENIKGNIYIQEIRNAGEHLEIVASITKNGLNSDGKDFGIGKKYMIIEVI